MHDDLIKLFVIQFADLIYVYLYNLTLPPNSGIIEIWTTKGTTK